MSVVPSNLSFDRFDIPIGANSLRAVVEFHDKRKCTSVVDCDNHCTIYSTRPNNCVAMETGDDQCQSARSRLGLLLKGVGAVVAIVIATTIAIIVLYRVSDLSSIPSGSDLADDSDYFDQLEHDDDIVKDENADLFEEELGNE